jgi:hypothetical protein
LAGGVVDAVGVGLGGVVFPQLDPGVGFASEFGEAAEGVPSWRVGSMVQAVKSMPMPAISLGLMPAWRSTSGTVRLTTST